MIAESMRLNKPVNDKDFDEIYPVEMRKLSKRHFTEVDVALMAAQLLVTKPQQRILDIGSGLGKFCFVAGSYTEASYVGVDYRKHYIDLCDKLTVKHRFRNVSFIHDDIVNVDFSQYDAFYFFNSFLEHWDRSAELDDTINFSYDKYVMYSKFLKDQFEKLPEATRIVTYHAEVGQIPGSYRLVSIHFGGQLKCWEKTANPSGKLP